MDREDISVFVTNTIDSVYQDGLVERILDIDFIYVDDLQMILEKVLEDLDAKNA